MKQLQQANNNNQPIDSNTDPKFQNDVAWCLEQYLYCFFPDTTVRVNNSFHLFTALCRPKNSRIWLLKSWPSSLELKKLKTAALSAQPPTTAFPASSQSVLMLSDDPPVGQQGSNVSSSGQPNQMFLNISKWLTDVFRVLRELCPPEAIVQPRLRYLYNLTQLSCDIQREIYEESDLGLLISCCIFVHVITIDLGTTADDLIRQEESEGLEVILRDLIARQSVGREDIVNLISTIPEARPDNIINKIMHYARPKEHLFSTAPFLILDDLN